jgi:hypothetical protein
MADAAKLVTVTITDLGLGPIECIDAADLEFEYIPPIEELFPQWLTARIIIKQWIDGISGWSVKASERDNHTCEIGLAVERDLRFLVPPEDMEHAWLIVMRTLSDYIGSMISDYVNRSPYWPKMDEVTFQQMRMLLINNEQEKIARGYGSIKDAMAKAFGLGRMI